MTDSIPETTPEPASAKKFRLTLYILMTILMIAGIIALHFTVFSPATAENTPYSVMETKPATNEHNKTFRIFHYYDANTTKQPFTECGKTDPSPWKKLGEYYCATENNEVVFTYSLARYGILIKPAITVDGTTHLMRCAQNEEENGWDKTREICIPLPEPTPTPTRETHTEQQTLPPYTPEKG